MLEWARTSFMKNLFYFSFLLLSFFSLSGCEVGDPISGEEPAEVESVEGEKQSYLDIDYGYGLGLLPLGDDKTSSTPELGSIYSCDTRLNGGGAFKDGEWIHSLEGYWDPSGKVTVDGEVDWSQASFEMIVDGDERIFKGNGLPDHTTGIYPISSSDDAYTYDRNPNSIQEQNIEFSLPLYPELASSPHCVSGVVGIANNGVPIFNGFDAGGRDAVAHEIQDACGGHPERTGQYHYHNISACVEEDLSEADHSGLVAYALDGFGIYGSYGEDGEFLSNDDLDACHGHMHAIQWEGETVEMYHYHGTAEFPYTVSCFMGEVDQSDLQIWD